MPLRLSSDILSREILYVEVCCLHLEKNRALPQFCGILVSLNYVDVIWAENGWILLLHSLCKIAILIRIPILGLRETNYYQPKCWIDFPFNSRVKTGWAALVFRQHFNDMKTQLKWTVPFVASGVKKWAWQSHRGYNKADVLVKCCSSNGLLAHLHGMHTHTHTHLSRTLVTTLPLLIIIKGQQGLENEC